MSEKILGKYETFTQAALDLAKKESDKEIDVETYDELLEKISSTIKPYIDSIEKPRKKMEFLTKALYGVGFRHKKHGFFLNDVIDNRGGSDLGLTSLYIALGEKLDLPIYSTMSRRKIFARFDDGKEKIDIYRFGIVDPKEHKKIKIHKKSLEKGVYLDTLSKNEAVGVIITFIAATYADSYDFKSSLNYLKDAIKLNKRYPDAYGLRGYSHLYLEDYEKAIRDFNIALDLDPLLADYYNDRGVAYGRIGEMEKAVEDFYKAIEIDPNYAEAYLNLGMSYHEKGNYEEAKKYYDKALELNPKEPLTYENRGKLFMVMRRYKSAIDDFIVASRLEPDNMYVRMDLAAAYFEFGDFESALEEYAEIIQTDPEFAKKYKVDKTFKWLHYQISKRRKNEVNYSS